MRTGLDVHMLGWGPLPLMAEWDNPPSQDSARGGEALASDPVGHPALAWGPWLPGEPRPTSAGPQ